MLKISIISGHQHVQSRTIKSGKIFYFQTAYAAIGGAFPSQFDLTILDPNSAYPVGEYAIDPSSFKVGAFKNLELNNYALKLIPILNDKK